MCESAEELKDIIIDHREDGVRRKGSDLQAFRKDLLQGGSMSPQTAEDWGLIDGVLSYNKFISIESFT
jgi:ATP-dependent protease ClpP protease subunit